MLLNYRESKVVDALLLSSIKPQNMIGFPARSINYYIDGKRYNKKAKMLSLGNCLSMENLRL